MVIYIGADHRGYELKTRIKTFLGDRGYEVVDVGDARYDENDDYPEFAAKVAAKVSKDYEQARGIVLCGSGAGVDIVANKFPHVRSILAATSDQAFDARNDDDVNVLSLAANYLEAETAEKIVATFIESTFSREDRHLRRLKKIAELEIKLTSGELPYEE